MGREKKILLGFLGLLAGVFVGVLSMKLLVPRPPTGAGPDVCTAPELTTAQERVEPPAAGGWDFSAAPPIVPNEAGPVPPREPEPLPDEPPRFSRFAAAPAGEATAGEPRVDRPATQDRDVAPATWQRPEPTAQSPPIAAVARAVPPVEQPPVEQPPPSRSVPVAGDYLVRAGDSWWDVAERAYGDGGLYRALFAWNRARDPRISLAPGTRLDVPPFARLQAAWPRLVTPAGSRR